MARLHSIDKILKYAQKANIKDKSLVLLTRILKDAQKASISDYRAKERDYILELFNGSYEAYYLSFIQLRENELIKLDRNNDNLIVTALFDHHLNNLIYSLKQKNNKYKRDPIKQQQGLVDILTSGKLGKIVETALVKAAKTDPIITYKFKDAGFKVPESLFPYLTGELMTNEQRSILMKYNQLDQITLEELRRDLSKETKRAYCACMSFCNEDGIIEDYNEYSLLQSVYKQFGKDSFVQYTWYLAMDKLRALKLIEEFYDREKDCNCLRIIGYKSSFVQGDRFVFVPYAVFSSKFKKLEAASMKIFFHLIFQLNNGENIDKYGNIQFVGQDKYTFFKVARLDVEQEENKIKFSNKLSWIKKRFPNEIRAALFGDAARGILKEPKSEEVIPEAEALGIEHLKVKLSNLEYKALSEYFHFQYVSGTALIVRIRKEYFISKKAEMLKQHLSLHGRYKRKVQFMEDILKDRNIEYTKEDMVSFVKVFKRANRKTIKLVLNILADRLQKGKEQGWDRIRSLGAYVQTLYQKYRSGSIDQLIGGELNIVLSEG